MNIVFLLNSTYPHYTGGRETWINNVCNRLCAQHKVFVITERSYKTDMDDGVFTNIDSRITIIPTNHLKMHKLLVPLFRSYLNWIYQEMTAMNMRDELKKLLETLVPQNTLLITMDTVFMGKIGTWAKKNYPDIMYVSSVRGPHAEITGDYYPLLRHYFLNVERKNLSVADSIWANGWDTQAVLAKKGFDSVVMKNGLDAKRVNTIDTTTELPMAQCTNLITIGSLLDIKGYPELIEAIGILKNDYDVLVNVVVLGKGDPAKYMDSAKKLGITDLIHFIGERRETVEIAAKFDIAACLSGGGGLSMACLESMLSQTPVIAWDSPVYRQMIVHMESGYLVKEKDPMDLAQGILWLMNHKPEAVAMGIKAADIAKTFDWNCVISDIEKEIIRHGTHKRI